MRISVIVPTYRRPLDLARCLDALIRQELPPFEVVVIHREDDDDTLAVLRDFAGQLPLKPASVREAGVVLALNRGLDVAAGEIVAMTDDDAAPRADWTRLILRYFADDPGLTGLGGRDRVHSDGGVLEGACPRVGLVDYFGRCTGNHHLGVGPPRDVDILKGVNMSFRVSHLDGQRFDIRLRGDGAQIHNELAFCLALRKKKRRLVYDPEVVVDHYPSVRHDYDKRSVFHARAREDEAYNLSLTLLSFLPAHRRVLFLLWAAVLGTRRLPGVAVCLVEPLSARGRPTGGSLLVTMTGLLQGTRAWWRAG